MKSLVWTEWNAWINENNASCFEVSDPFAMPPTSECQNRLFCFLPPHTQGANNPFLANTLISFLCNSFSHLVDQSFKSTYLLIRVFLNILTPFAVFRLYLLVASAASRAVNFRFMLFLETIGGLTRKQEKKSGTEVISDYLLVVWPSGQFSNFGFQM